MTHAEVLLEVKAIRYFQNPNLIEEVVDEDFDQDAILEQLAEEAESNPDDWEEVDEEK